MSTLFGHFSLNGRALPEVSGCTLVHERLAFHGEVGRCYHDKSSGWVTLCLGIPENLAELRGYAGLVENSSTAQVISCIFALYPVADAMQRLGGGVSIIRCNVKTGEWLLARDRCGFQRLCYSFSENNSVLNFADSPAPLHTAGAAWSLEALTGYLTTGAVPAPFTIYQDIHLVPASKFCHPRAEPTILPPAGGVPLSPAVPQPPRMKPPKSCCPFYAKRFHGH